MISLFLIKILDNYESFNLGQSGLSRKSAKSKFEHNPFFSEVVSSKRSDLNLNEIDVKEYISKYRPDFIVNAAAKVGGILANDTFKSRFYFGKP